MTIFPIRARILLFTAFLSTMLFFSAKAYVVTELGATYRNGQVFITWKNPVATNLQYNVYRSTLPFLSAADLTTSAYLGYVRDNSGKNIRKSSLTGGNHYFKIDAAASPLASDRGLYVATSTNNAFYYYAVMVVNLSNGQEDKSVVNASNSLIIPVAEVAADPKPVLQLQGVENDGTLRYEYAQWGNNQDASHYPAFTNAGSYAWNFTVLKKGNSTNKSIYMLFKDDNPFSTSGSNICTDCNVIKIDDRLPNGSNTYWTGWNENYNMYSTTNPVATSGVVKMYTQARLKETLQWLKKNISADSNKVYLSGTSHNAYGALLTSQMWPNQVTAVFAKNAPILIKPVTNSEREQQWSDRDIDLNSDFIDPNSGLFIPLWELFDIGHMYKVNTTNGIPFTTGLNGKQDVTVGWIQKYFWYDTVNATRQGGAWYWDQRTHNNSGSTFIEAEATVNYERFTLARSYPAFSFCSVNQNPGNGTPADGAPVGAINGYLDWSDQSIVDNSTSYGITCFVKNMYAGGVLMTNQYDSCTTDITFRRLQNFKPVAGQVITWSVKKNGGNTVQQGTTVYTGGPITLHGVKIYRVHSNITMSVPDCSTIYYVDADHDGYGSSADPGTTYCSAPIGLSTNNSDCNDANIAINPLGQEVCDANDVDEDCDGLSDDGDLSALGKIIYYIDADHDGHGSISDPGALFCNPSSVLINNHNDCNDADASINPAATELCNANAVDEDCDGLTDNADPSAIGTIIYYADADADNYGSSVDPGVAYCHPPSGVVLNNADCNDASALMHPEAVDMCDELDNNCNGIVDENAITVSISPSDSLAGCKNDPFTLTASGINIDSYKWYKDNNPNSVAGQTNSTYDLDYENTTVYAVVSNSFGCTATSNVATITSIANPAASITVLNSGNLNLCEGEVSLLTSAGTSWQWYRNETAIPGATDISYAVTGNGNYSVKVTNIYGCDKTSVEVNVVGQITFYPDADQDGYGSSSETGSDACIPLPGMVTNNIDCNDADAAIHPFATELCDVNDVDEECDGLADDGDPSAVGKIIYYADADNDGYGTTSDPGFAYCNPLPGVADNNNDCNDNNPSAHPDATELCDVNDVDEDCNGLADDDDPSVIGKIIYYTDTDNDGYGVTSDPGTAYCNAPSGMIDNNADCNDADVLIHPAATELCNVNGVDEDCDGLTDDADPSAAGAVTYYIDADEDGYGYSSDPGVNYCNPPSGVVLNNSDCNDADISVHPFASEICDASDVDENCNGLADDADVSTIGKVIYYSDADQDGFGASDDPGTAYCNPPSLMVINNNDCNDAAVFINPFATELCDANDADEDCNGLADDADPSSGGKIIYYADADHDSYGSSYDSGTLYCNPPSGLVMNNADCNDAVASINPLATELCDANDNDEDCDGLADDADPSAAGKISYYPDADLDSYGNSSGAAAFYCNPPAGVAANNTDCNDASATIHPAASDKCDGLDNNCNGITDENAITVSVSPAGPVSGCKNDFFTLTATGTNIGSYKWYKGTNPNSVSGQTNSTYTLDYENTTVKAVVSNSFGCSATSNVVNVTGITQPAALVTALNGGNLNLCNGPVNLTTSAGTGWQWYRNEILIPGATTINYTVTSNGNYTAKVTNLSGCSKTSAPVTAFGQMIYYVDADQDGYGSSSVGSSSYCIPPPGMVTNNSDCNDAANFIHPLAIELCDANDADEDCDGLSDDSDPSAIGKIIYYVDADLDGHGSPSDPGTAFCNQPSGKAVNNNDCNDGNASVHPAAAELCDTNDVDEDCSGLADDDDPSVIGKIVYYADADQDGFGSPVDPGVAYCNPPSGVVISNNDCDDATAAIHPSASELCDANQADEDCDGLADDADPSVTGTTVYYADADEDGYGSSSDQGIAYCLPPSGLVINNTDCNDAENGIHPDASEFCDVNGIDENCNGLDDNADPAAIGKVTYYIDADNDGYGLSSDPGTYCYPPPGMSVNNIDCNDTDASSHPFATEMCDANDVDEDCNGLSDDNDASVIGKIIYYVDSDNDGYGSPSDPGTAYCNPPSGVVINNTDCNDSNPAVYHNGIEVCDANDIDEDCDGVADDADPSSTGKIIYYADADQDGYGDAADPGTSYCNPPSEKVSNNNDCNDAANAVHPLAAELCDMNDVDEDCDGLSDDGDPSAIGKIIYYTDADQDGFGAAAASGLAYCNPPSAVASNNNDCNDGNASSNPSANEQCDAQDVDEDCDGLTDDADPSVIGKIIYYVDADNDGYGSPLGTGTAYCNPPLGMAGNKNDCNETNPSINPSATELCDANDIDEDCDGMADNNDSFALGKLMYYVDADQDGYGTSSIPGTAYCTPPPGLVTSNTDCMDDNANVRPGVTEICDGIDNNCNGVTDENLIQSNPMPQPVITAVGATSFCYDQSVTLNAQAGFNQYTWSNAKTGQSVTANTPGGITVTVKDANNCYGTSAPMNLTVWDPPAPIITCSGPITYCIENPSTLSVVSGYSYLWKKGSVAIAGATNHTYAPTSTNANYKVTLSDINGCSKTSESFSVTVNTAATPTLTGATSICQGQSTTITATAGYSSYLWSSGQTTSAISVSAAGNYFVTATDENGCSATSATKTIIVNTLPQPVITALSATSFCNGGSVILDAGAGYNTYSWSNGKNTQTVTITTSGTYSVTVTNANGCSGTSLPVTVTVWIPPTPTISTSIGNTTFCANSGVYLTTLPGYSYQWQKSSIDIVGATNQNFTPTSSGSYKVIITDIHGCSKTSLAFSIIVNSNPVPVITGPAVICVGSSVTLSGGTFAAYNWSTGSQASTTNVNAAGSYTVTVTDANGCLGTSAPKITSMVPLPTPAITAQGPIQFCDGGSVTLDAGSGYTSYSWSNAKTTQTNAITASGTFTVTVTNSNGCVGTSAPVTVDEWILPTPTISTSIGATTFCANTGVYLTTLPGYSYQWQKSNVDIVGATNQNFTPTSGGSYKVIITDIHQCSKTSSAFSIVVNSNPTPVITGPAVVCQGSSVTLSCGTFNSYNWSTGAQSSTISVNSSGSFTVTVTDGNGCAGTSSLKSTTLVPLPTPVITAQGPIQFCDGGSVTLDAGSGYTNYSWSNAKTTQTNAITASGTFTVTVTNSNGCVGTSAPVTVDEWIPPTPTVSIVGPSTYCANSGNTYLTTLSGSFTYQWIKGTADVAGATGQNFSPSSSGTYKVKITEVHGCSKTSTGVTITVNTAPTASINISGSANICAGQTKTITANGGSGLSYLWKRDGNNIPGATAISYVAAIAGNYTCVVTNSNGCSTTSNTIAITSNCKGDEQLVQHEEEVTWLLYPNPTNRDLHIRLNLGGTEQGSYIAEIRNLLGGIIWRNESSFTDHAIEEDVYLDRSLADGVYFVIVRVGDHSYHSQFIMSKK